MTCSQPITRHREVKRVGARGRSKLTGEVLWELLAQPPAVACGGSPILLSRSKAAASVASCWVCVSLLCASFEFCVGSLINENEARSLQSITPSPPITHPFPPLIQPPALSPSLSRTEQLICVFLYSLTIILSVSFHIPLQTLLFSCISHACYYWEKKMCSMCLCVCTCLQDAPRAVCV